MTTTTASLESDSPLLRLAELLVDARRTGRPISEVPDDLVPPTVRDAQIVDDLVAEISGWPVVGWKIGCTSTYAQELLGSDGPFAGRVYSVRETGATIGATDLPSEAMLEGEFAFTIGSTLAGEAHVPTRSDVVAAIADVRPAIEVVGGRYVKFVGLDLRLIVADAGANALLVVGPPVTGLDFEQLGTAGAEMTVDGTQTGAGTGADVLGHPLDALHWLTTHLAGRGIALETNQIVTTGTATQVANLPAGASATAAFENVGTVSLSRR